MPEYPKNWPEKLKEELTEDILRRYDNGEYWNPDIVDQYFQNHPDQFNQNLCLNSK